VRPGSARGSLTRMFKRIAGSKVGQCRMCSAQGPLILGHVIPAFVWRWLKDTSATGFLRGGENPDIRVQDGWRRYWFCRRCEDTVSRFERRFSEDLFPLVVSEASAPYRHGPWLSRFLASVALRVLMLHEEVPDAFKLFTPAQSAALPQAREAWRAFVNGEAATPGIHDLHFVPLGRLAHYGGNLALPPNFNRWSLRSIEVHVASNNAQAFAYMKMGPALAFGLIQPPSAPLWVGSRVGLKDGYVGGNLKLSVNLLQYLIERAERLDALNKRRSRRQEEKIAATMRANPERAATSETFLAVDADVQRFGSERVFPRKRETDKT
jgi:hypothetical protein